MVSPFLKPVNNKYARKACIECVIVVDDDGIGFSRLAFGFIALQPARISFFFSMRKYVYNEIGRARGPRATLHLFFLFFQRLRERTTQGVSMGKKKKKKGIMKHTRLGRQCISAKAVMSTPIAPLDRRKPSSKQDEEKQEEHHH